MLETPGNNAFETAGIDANLESAATVTPTTVLGTPRNNAFDTILILCADEITKATTNLDMIEIVRNTLRLLISQSRKEIEEMEAQETRSQYIASKSWRKGHNKGNRTLINQLKADIVVYDAFLGSLSELSDELFFELSSSFSLRVQFLQMDKMFLEEPVKFVQRVLAQHLKCRNLYVPKSVSMKFSKEIMQRPMVVTLLCMLYGVELLCNRDSEGWCRFTKLHNSMTEIKEISKAAMTKHAMHFTASSYFSALDLNNGDVVLVELWNYQTSDEHAPMACDRGQLDLTIPSNNRNGFIQSR